MFRALTRHPVGGAGVGEDAVAIAVSSNDGAGL